MKETKPSPTMKICEKAFLTVEEAAIYTNIGVSRIREISDNVGSEITLFVGTKRLLKRENLVNWLNNQHHV